MQQSGKSSGEMKTIGKDIKEDKKLNKKRKRPQKSSKQGSKSASGSGTISRERSVNVITVEQEKEVIEQLPGSVSEIVIVLELILLTYDNRFMMTRSYRI